jgi:hypothetical protein
MQALGKDYSVISGAIVFATLPDGTVLPTPGDIVVIEYFR